MSRFNLIARFVAPLALVVLSACAATPFKAQVNRFQMMPAPQGQSFYVKADDPKLAGSLEFSQYAGLVGEKLSALGYQPASSPAAASLIVNFDYGVDNGREKLRSVPGSGFGYDPFWGTQLLAAVRQARIQQYVEALRAKAKIVDRRKDVFRTQASADAAAL